VYLARDFRTLANETKQGIAQAEQLLTRRGNRVSHVQNQILVGRMSQSVGEFIDQECAALAGVAGVPTGRLFGRSLGISVR
jgi:hypothetical protein